MTTILLPKEYETRLDEIAKEESTTKSEIIKDALAQYFRNYEESVYPFEVGKDLFGVYGSGRGNLSREYKQIVRERIGAKRSR